MMKTIEPDEKQDEASLSTLNSLTIDKGDILIWAMSAQQNMKGRVPLIK